MAIEVHLSICLGIEFWIAIAINALARGLRFACRLARFILL